MFTQHVTPEQDGEAPARRRSRLSAAEWRKACKRASEGGTEDPRLVRINACAPDARTWLDRLWARLGFGMARAPRDIEEGAEERAAADGFVLGSLVVTSFVTWGWPDRLRILISGRTMMETATQTDVIVLKSRATAAQSVLPPGSKHGRRS